MTEISLTKICPTCGQPVQVTPPADNDKSIRPVCSTCKTELELDAEEWEKIFRARRDRDRRLTARSREEEQRIKQDRRRQDKINQVRREGRIDIDV